MVPTLTPVTVRVTVLTSDPPATGWLTDRACVRLALALGALSVLFHLAYLALGCPLDLSPDEAHYWHWSRHLDWNYYSKGPLVAWLIRASCEVFGPLSQQLVGSPMFAIRLPAVACHAALLAGLYVLAAGTLKSHKAALALVALALTFPPVAAGAVLMTIDPPFLVCWCWACVGVWKALSGHVRSEEFGVRSENRCYPSTAPLPAPNSQLLTPHPLLRWWLLAAVCTALGVLAKYPMVLLPCAVFGYLLVYRRAELRRAGFWLFAFGGLAGLVPVIVWNAANDWVSFRHVGTQAAGTGGSGLRWYGPFVFASGQIVFLIGAWFAVWACAAWAHRRSPDPARGFLWWCSVPVWGVFALASFKAAGQLNWPAVAYVTGSVLAVGWARDRLAGPHRRFVARLVAVGLALGVALSVLVHFPGLMRPALASVGGAPRAGNPAPIRQFDPTARLRGWKALAAEVDTVRARVRAEAGADPLVAGTVWNVPGSLGVYCAGNPATYSFGPAMGDRHSQYDLWRPNPVADPDVFRGRTFVWVGDGMAENTPVFERVELAKRFVYEERGVPVAEWWVWIGYGFRGFPDNLSGRRY